MLAVLNGLIPGTEADYVAHDITPVLGSLAEIDAWTAAARGAGRPLPAILQSTPACRAWAWTPRELAVLQQDHARLGGIDLRYVMTHLVASEQPDDPMNEAQRDRFQRACAGLPPAPRSLANSSGHFPRRRRFGSDLARPGAALYGINPTPGRRNPMRLPSGCAHACCRCAMCRPARRSATTPTWHAGRPSRIATAAIGYADGWHAHAFQPRRARSLTAARSRW